MGQTLTHGIYLPDEGERNCYSGLAANWQILDTSVGTIAAHTAALAGKAPLSHTHTKSEITDFPAYGNAAGTICEGNDSRLSDARTPVAHTHTKSDVTDLLNSNFIPSANNNYDLGSSTNQWKSVYAQSYYYGTTSFTDKFVTTDTNQNITSVKMFTVPQYSKSAFRFVNDSYTSGTPLTDVFYQSLVWGGFVNNVWRASFGINNAIRTNGYSDTSFRTYPQTSNTLTGFVLETNADASDVSFKPIATGTHNLGNSNYKWKTLNGINPGALSLPDYAHPTFLDVSAQGLNWHTDATPNFYTTPANGYFAVITQCPTISNGVLDIFVNNTGIGSSDHGTYAGNELFCYVPVNQGQIVKVRARCDNYYSVVFYPCLGNV